MSAGYTAEKCPEVVEGTKTEEERLTSGRLEKLIIAGEEGRDMLAGFLGRAAKVACRALA